MSTASAANQESAKASSRSRSSISTTSVLLPYGIAILAQVPMLFMYFRNLWSQPHYQFFPFAIIAFALFLVFRWPRSHGSPFFASLFSGILFWTAIPFAVLGTLFLTEWFCAFSTMLLITSLLARTKDEYNPDRSLIAVSLPLWVILQPPMQTDLLLITNLQVLSASITSNYLDLLNLKHYLPGTVIEFPNEKYGVEQACSGVQSFFTLLFCASVFIVATRRPWFRATLLLIAAVFWAVFMNTVRILLIPVADIWFGANLKDGLPHDILGYCVLLVAILLVLSTDQFLTFVFGAVDKDSIGSGHPMRRAIARFWNKYFAGSDPDAETTTRQRRRRTKPSMTFRSAIWIGAIIVGLMGVVQLFEVQRSLANPNLRVRFFNTNVILPFVEADMPELVESKDAKNTFRWEKFESPENEIAWYQVDDRERRSDLGQRSDSWKFKSATSGFPIVISVDQTFPGWHELTQCYKNQGWTLEDRQFKQVTIPNPDGEGTDTWPYIQADFIHKTTGSRGFLLFCFSDGMGVPYQAPKRWGGITAFFERAKNRMGHQFRKRVFRGEAYQIQAFVETSGGLKLNEKQKEEIRVQFEKIRGIVRQKLIDKSKGKDAEDALAFVYQKTD